jgi:hypothetical protein
MILILSLLIMRMMSVNWNKNFPLIKSGLIQYPIRRGLSSSNKWGHNCSPKKLTFQIQIHIKYCGSSHKRTILALEPKRFLQLFKSPYPI